MTSAATVAGSQPRERRGGGGTTRRRPGSTSTARSPGKRRPSLAIEIDWQTPDTDPPARLWLPRSLRRIAQHAGVRRGRIGLAIVADPLMASLHQQYKNVAGTTDVLTFDLRESATQAVDGDIVICRDEAQRQARRRGHPARLELLLYAVHGLLHLLGYDDHEAADAKAMHRREDELLVAAGFGAVYRPGARGTP